MSDGLKSESFAHKLTSGSAMLAIASSSCVRNKHTSVLGTVVLSLAHLESLFFISLTASFHSSREFPRKFSFFPLIFTKKSDYFDLFSKI